MKNFKSNTYVFNERFRSPVSVDSERLGSVCLSRPPSKLHRETARKMWHSAVWTLQKYTTDFWTIYSLHGSLHLLRQMLRMVRVVRKWIVLKHAWILVSFHFAQESNSCIGESVPFFRCGKKILVRIIRYF